MLQKQEPAARPEHPVHFTQRLAHVRDAAKGKRADCAIEAATRAIQSYPEYPHPYRWLAAALGQVGRAAAASAALEKAIAIVPGSFDMYVRSRVPWFRLEDYEHMIGGLRKAGWRTDHPENAGI